MTASGPGSGQAASADRPADEVGVAETTPETTSETRGARFAREAHRTRLYLFAGVAAALLVFLVALVLANTSRVKVSWVFGSSAVSLVWLVLITAIVGVVLGMVLSGLFHWRTRTPRA